MKWNYSSVIVTLHVTCRLQGYARVYDQSENKEIGGRGAKLGGGGAKTFGGGAMAPPLATGLPPDHHISDVAKWR